MKTLRELIKEELLLEKRIAQISSSIEISFSFDVNTTTHSDEQKVRTDIEDYNETPVSNAEIRDVIRQVIKVIAEKIVTQEIIPEEEFIIKSLKWELSLVILPKHISGTYWKLLVETVFRESESHSLRVGKDQLVIYTDVE